MVKESVRSALLLIIILGILPEVSAYSLTHHLSDAESLSASTWHRVQDESSPDTKLFRFINTRLANPLFDTVMPVITNFNKSKIILLLVWSALVMFGGSKGKWAALALIPLLVASDQISSNIMKPLFQRLRPCEVLGSVHFWQSGSDWITTPAKVTKSYKSSLSFPSGHAANITASMLFLGLVYRKLLAPFLVIAAIVSFSRIYVGVHWPLDVAAGISLGVLLAVVAYYFFRRFAPKDKPAYKTDKPD
ncbi:phosphatase PAP2 family protein [bacterium]|nr:phosphatase PAP2 family protein [bacterium]